MYYFRSDILPHSSWLTGLIDGSGEGCCIFLVEPLKPLLFKGMKNDSRLDYDYNSPIQQQIEQSGSKTWHSWCDFGLISYFHENTSDFSLAMM
jgi:hypothetical protein